MTCCNNCSKLWRVWYILLIFAFNVYLIYSAILRYLSFKTQVFDQRYGLNWSHTPLNFYLAMIILALTCLCFMIYSGVARVGNHANDNVVIGRDHSTLKLALSEMTGRPERNGSAWRRLRRHFLPFYGFLHVCTALCLLLPLPLLAAERIRNEILTKSRVWHTDLDFIFQPDRQHKPSTDKDKETSEILPVSPEMANLVIGLVHLTVRYPSTFWFSNRWFSLLFSCLIFTASVHLILQNSVMSVLYKLSYNNMSESGSGLSTVALLCLHSISFLIVMCAQYTIFEYGYTQFLDNLRKYRQYFVTSSDSTDDVMSELGPSASSTTVASGTVNRNKANVKRRRMACLQKYMPHILAAVFTCSALAFQGPLVWDSLRIYRLNADSLCLCIVIFSVIHLCVWISAWFCFALKPSWNFQINIPIQTVSEITHGKMASSTGPGVGSADANALYACFHDNPALSNSPNNTRPPSIDCCSDSSKTSSQSNRHNYVFLTSACHPPPPHIPTISEHVTNSEPGGNSTQSQMTFDSRMAPPPPPPPPPLSSACMTSAEQRAGLLKYAVQRTGSVRSFSALGSASSSNCVDSTGSVHMIPSTVMGASLTRNGKLRKSYNRVTFREHSTLPGSPQSESTNNTMSSDSGIDGSHRFALARSALGSSTLPPVTHNYEDYQLLGNLIKEPTYYNHQDFVNYVDVYGPNGGPPPPPPPPASMCEPDRVPDILQSQHSTTPSSGIGIRLGMAAVAGGRRSPLDSKSYTSSLLRRGITTTPTPPPPPPPPPPMCDDDEEDIELTEQKPMNGISLTEEAEQRLWSQV